MYLDCAPSVGVLVTIVHCEQTKKLSDASNFVPRMDGKGF